MSSPGAESRPLSEPLHCPVCNGQDLLDRGRIFHHGDIQYVAGVAIDLRGYEFQMKACPRCGFQFKYPSIPEQLLLDCYAAAEGDHWGAEVDPQQRNFDRMRAAIERFRSFGRILDVGCFNGAFLSYLGARWERFGVEPSEQAAEVARSRAIEIVAKTVEGVPEDSRFDVITAIDVVEHIVDPTPFFEKLVGLLSPRGILMISTGDTSSATWRLQGPRYWYCSYVPEHVSYFSPRTLEFIGARYGLSTVHQQRISHKRTPISVQLKQGLKGAVFSGLLHSRWLMNPWLRRKYEARVGTDWTAAQDHMLHVLQRA